MFYAIISRCDTYYFIIHELEVRKISMSTLPTSTIAGLFLFTFFFIHFHFCICKIPFREKWR